MADVFFLTGATGFLGTMLAAGGLGTPPILEKSGIPCQSRLFVDPVLCVADASILPKAMGNPPILTIMALAKKIAEIV